MLRPLPFAAALALVLAGCADEGPGTDSEDLPTPGAFEDVQVSDTTGAIRGIVVTEAIVPIEGVLVTLAGGANKTTDADGAFVFSNLEPGDYFLTASKLGYLPVQASATVVAGEEEPSVTKVTLLVDADNQPFTSLQQWRAFLQCGAGIPSVGSVNPCAVADSDNVHDFPFDGRLPDYAQTEAFWEGTQPLGNQLSMGFYDPDSLASNWKGRQGQSPLMVNATQAEITEALGEDADLLTVRLFPGTSSPTVITNQAYDVYVTYFYGFTPRAGWMFVVDGPCDQPAKCS